MSLDLCLEADSTLTISTLSKALANAGAWEIEKRSGQCSSRLLNKHSPSIHSPIRSYRQRLGEGRWP